jgi:LysM repeat protein
MLISAAGAAAQVYVRISTTEIVEGGRTYILHNVSRSETIYSICRAYGIADKELMSLNPFLKKGLKAGQQIKIPKKTTAAKKTSAAPPNIIYHIIKSGETFYSIARKYGVKPDELQEFNSGQESILYEGAILRVPQYDKNHDYSIPQAKEKEIVREDFNGFQHTEAYAPSYCSELEPYSKTIRIALLLPFGVSNGKTDGENLLRAFEFAEFYEGMQAALHSLSKHGANIKLYSWDANSSNIRSILAQQAFLDADLIVGPVYAPLFNIAARNARERGIPIISPLAVVDSAQHGNEYVFQVAINEENLAGMLMEHFLADAEDANLVYITHDGARAEHDLQRLYQKYMSDFNPKVYHNHRAQLDSLGLSRLTAEYENRQHSASLKQIHYQTGILPRGNHETFFRVFSRNEINRVVIASDDEPFVADILANLNAFSDFYGCYIEVYGTNKWRKFENIELETYYNLNLHIAAPYFVDYHAEHVMDFIRDYRLQYRGEPTQLAFQGYDVGAYFAGALYRFGLNNFMSCLPAYKVKLMQSDYKFAAGQRGFHPNNGGFLIRYMPETMKIEPYK